MKLPTRLSACAMTTAIMLGSASLQSATAQGTSLPPAAPSVGGAAPPPILKGPSFQTAGLKLTVVGSSVGTNSIALSLILENVGKNDLLVGVIGPVVGVTGGTNLASSNSVSGIANCQYGYEARTTQIEICLTRDKPALPVQQFTLIEHGNTIPFTVTLSTLNNAKFEKSQSLGLSMTAAILPDDSNSDDSSNGASSRTAKPPAPGTLPSRMRFISLGIPVVPLGDGAT